MSVGLPEDHIPVLGNLFLELLLQVPTSVLVLTQVEDIALQFLQPHSGEAVVYARNGMMSDSRNDVESGLTFTIAIGTLRLHVHVSVTRVQGTGSTKVVVIKAVGIVSCGTGGTTKVLTTERGNGSGAADFHSSVEGIGLTVWL